MIKNMNAYDKQSKQILSDKDVLSYIMKECIPEYKKCTIEEIKKYIEDGNDCKYIKGLRNEDSKINDATIAYDILFTSKVPDSNEEIGMYINIEAQNISRPSYPLINRAIYYASRLISKEKGEDFKHSDYQKIRKVYSIWICINPNEKDAADTINFYTLSEQCVKGNYHIKDDYKLFNIIMLNVGRNYNYKDKKKDVLEMLSLLFTNTGLEAKEITNILNRDYGIIKKEEEISKMCSLSGSILEQGIEQGIKQGIEQGVELGIEQGVEQGIEQGVAKTIINMLDSGMQLDEAFSISKASKSVQKLVKEMLNNLS